MSYDARPRGRNVVERSFNVFQNRRGVATQHDNLTYPEVSSSPQSSPAAPTGTHAQADR